MIILSICGRRIKNNPAPSSTTWRLLNVTGSGAACTWNAWKQGGTTKSGCSSNLGEYPLFSVRNVKVNGTIWTGEDDNTFEYFQPEEVLDEHGRFNENPLSLALKISYGDFDYFTGGDVTGAQGLGEPWWFDVETPVAKAVGEVDVLTLNHHGNRDATNANFLRALRPRVIVQQSWVSDHPGGEVLQRMISRYLYPGPRDIFATNMLEETKAAVGPWLTNAYKSMQGHILVRVSPGGAEYFVYILDDTSERLLVTADHGPYRSN